MNKILRKTTYVIFLTLFIICINNNVFAMEGEQNHEQLMYIPDKGYYYGGDDGKFYTSSSENILRRINDTFYFVDYQGKVYSKHYNFYTPVPAPYLDLLIGDKIVYDNLKNVHIDALPYSDRQPVFAQGRLLGDPVDDVIYVNHTFPGPTRNDTCLVGDSYAYLLASNVSENIEFSVRPGYTATAVKNELLPLVNYDGIKNCIIFIGPNDLMAHTDFSAFEYEIRSMCWYLKERGVTPIFTSYLKIDTPDFYYGEKAYDDIIEKVAGEEDAAFVYIEDIDEYVKRSEYDVVHPDSGFYKPAFERILEFINIFNFFKSGR